MSDGRSMPDHLRPNHETSGRETTGRETARVGKIAGEPTAAAILWLALEPRLADGLERHPELDRLRVGEAAATRAETVFYDTPSGELDAHGVHLAVRRTGRRRLQLLSLRDDEESVLLRPPASEWRTLADRPDLSLIGDPRLAARLPTEMALPLKPVFTITTDCRRFGLRPIDSEASADPVEVWVERARLAVGDRVSTCWRARLRATGAPHAASIGGRLFDAALILARLGPVRMASEMLAETGYRMMRGAAARAHHAGSNRLEPGVSVAQGFVAIIAQCLRHLLANETPILDRGDPDAVHQMRVALRRLRAALSLFGDSIGKGERDLLRQELRWLAQTLGEARDWEVFIAQTLASARLLPGGAAAADGGNGVERLARAAEPCREAARRRIVEAVRSERYALLILRLGAWLEGGRWCQGIAPREAQRLDEKLSQHAVRLLDRQAKRVRRRGKGFRDQLPEERHDLRKALKKLRYDAAFLRSFFPGKRAERYLGLLEALQDTMGEANDAAVARSLLRQIRVEGEPGLALDCAALEAWLDARTAGQADMTGERWRSFTRAKPFWA
jgi:CHAD domain-containing protein